MTRIPRHSRLPLLAALCCVATALAFILAPRADEPAAPLAPWRAPAAARLLPADVAHAFLRAAAEGRYDDAKLFAAGEAGLRGPATPAQATWPELVDELKLREKPIARVEFERERDAWPGQVVVLAKVEFDNEGGATSFRRYRIELKGGADSWWVAQVAPVVVDPHGGATPNPIRTRTDGGARALPAEESSYSMVGAGRADLAAAREERSERLRKHREKMMERLEDGKKLREARLAELAAARGDAPPAASPAPEASTGESPAEESASGASASAEPNRPLAAGPPGESEEKRAERFERLRRHREEMMRRLEEGKELRMARLAEEEAARTAETARADAAGSSEEKGAAQAREERAERLRRHREELAAQQPTPEPTPEPPHPVARAVAEFESSYQSMHYAATAFRRLGGAYPPWALGADAASVAAGSPSMADVPVLAKNPWLLQPSSLLREPSSDPFGADAANDAKRPPLGYYATDEGFLFFSLGPDGDRDLTLDILRERFRSDLADGEEKSFGGYPEIWTRRLPGLDAYRYDPTNGLVSDGDLVGYWMGAIEEGR